MRPQFIAGIPRALERALPVADATVPYPGKSDVIDAVPPLLPPQLKRHGAPLPIEGPKTGPGDGLGLMVAYA
jgi:hypothetical protein